MPTKNHKFTASALIAVCKAQQTILDSAGSHAMLLSDDVANIAYPGDNCCTFYDNRDF